MRIRWRQPTLSGLADRLTDILMLTAYARVRGAELHFEWQPFEAKGIDAEHRKTDILLENVQKFITFPPEVLFDDEPMADEFFDHYLGGGNKALEFHRSFVADKCSEADFLAAVASVAADFTFCPAITEFLKTVPKRFVTFHIRRGDKVRNESSDGNFVHVDELKWLDDATYRAIDCYINLGYDTFFVCGDENEKTAPFVNYIEKDKAKKVFKLPDMPKWEATYYDLATMTRSEHNVASQRYSSFSHFPTLIGKGTFITVFRLSAVGLI